MAAKGEKRNQPDPEDGHMKIPVFTVMKNGAILKNIFIVNKFPEPESIAFVHDYEDVLIVGRHPDCNIMLTHPSISRFHLQIQSNPSSQKLAVVDLSSVHGTWVSERKIEAGVSVPLKEGDTLRIGGSSRVYRLHWIPISQAYDLENPFESAFDLAVETEKGEEDDALPEEEKDDIVQNENFCSVYDEEVQSVDSILDSIHCLFADENLELLVKEEIHSAPSMSEDDFSVCCDAEGNCPSIDDHQEGKTARFSSFFGAETSNLPKNSESEQVLLPPHVEPDVECDNPKTAFEERISNFSVSMESLFHVKGEIEAYPEADKPRETNILSTLGEYLRESICLPVVEAVQGTKMEQFHEVKQNAPPDAFTSQLSPVKQKAPFEKPWSNLLINLDPAPFDIESAAAAAEMPKEAGFGCPLRDHDRRKDIITSGAGNLMTDNTSLPVEEAPLGTKFQPVKIIEEVALDSPSDGEKQNNCCEEHKSKFQLYQNASSPYEQGHSTDGIQDIGNKCTGSVCLISLSAESLNKPLPEESVKTTNKIKHQTQQSLKSVAECSQKKILAKATEKNSTLCNIWSRRGKAASAPQVRTSKSRVKSTANVDTEVDMSNQKEIKNKTISKDLLSVLDGEEEEIFTPDKENFSPNTLQLRFLKKGKEIKNKKISKDLLSVLDGEEEEIFTPDKENYSPNTLQLRFLKKGKVEDIKHSKSRKSNNLKDNFSPNIYYDEISISEKKNQPPKVAQEQKSGRRPFSSYIKLEQEQGIMDLSNQKDIINKAIPKDLLHVLDGEEEEEQEIFTPDKENFSPNSLQLLFLKKEGKMEEIKHSKSRRSHDSNDNFSPSIYPDENYIPISENEDRTPKVAKEQKSERRTFGCNIKLEQDIVALENRLERLPFQSLLTNSRGKSRPEISRPVSAAENINSSNCARFLDKCINPSHISKRSWNMVVDTASLLNKESRKALLLLQGLKGTRLIIPRMVIKELDSIKRQFNFFRRTSEASLVLEWIEECMVKTKWWIHVQSSMEEGRLIAPTPPASPQTQFSEESWTWPLSSHKSSMEIASPTAEDHILDCALMYRRMQNDEQLVVLSDDVTLKIKSMAEGLLCETVQEFRESLVNPFSERFLWANSSPRGLTWSCQDDVVLREKYCRFPLRKSSKGEGARGLKLILLHNSRYGKISSAR